MKLRMPTRSRPLDVIMDVTERCNLKCVMCYFSGTDRLRFAPFDRELSATGNMPTEVFEKIAADLFPQAWRVALGCAAEPLVHNRFAELVTIAGRHAVGELWFPTNLLALTDAKAEAIVAAGVGTVAISMDGVTAETYEKIRVGGKFPRLLERIELLHRVKARHRASLPRLRIIFTWMRSNRDELRLLPRFAAEHGVSELDVRFVAPTTGVDVGPELLSDEDPAALRAELAATAHEAVDLGLRLTSYPEFETADDRPARLTGRLRRRAWRWRAGLERPEYLTNAWREKRHGCAYPGRTYVVRPNGAVYPCVFWDRDPLGFYPDQDLGDLALGEPLANIRDGLACGAPVGTCATCTQRRDALYRPFREKLRVLPGRALG